LLKIYTLPNHTITIGVCILETQLLGLLYGGGASFVQKWSMPWMSANIQVPFLCSLISMVKSNKDILCKKNQVQYCTVCKVLDMLIIGHATLQLNSHKKTHNYLHNE
jgi:hypothetical protein